MTKRWPAGVGSAPLGSDVCAKSRLARYFASFSEGTAFAIRLGLQGGCHRHGRCTSESVPSYRTDVVIETPAGSPIKYAWDADAARFRAKKFLKLGIAFPFDFGFVPGTEAEDGDALDVLVVADA